MKYLSTKNLVSKLSNIKYGYYDNVNKKIITKDNELYFNDLFISKQCIVLKPKDFIKIQCGTNFDIIFFIANELNTNKYDTKLISYLYIKGIFNNKVTHYTTCIVKSKITNMYYWIDSPIEKYSTISSGMCNYNNIKNKIFHSFISRYGSINFINENISWHNFYNYDPLTISTFIQICTQVHK